MLIPKVKCPLKITELRPIALCNVVMKIMSKAIANRMKPLLDVVISDSHSEFIPRRLISDNVLVAYEIGHFMRRKRQGKTGWASLKMDMSKAYNRVEWRFIAHMLKALGFHEHFIQGIIAICFVFWLIILFHP